MGIWVSGDDKIGAAFERTANNIMGKSEPPQVPSPGRIVHYVMSISNEEVSCFPAIVRRVRMRNGHNSYLLDLAVFGPEKLLYENIVLYDGEEKRAWTWHWPERVTNDDELLALTRPLLTNGLGRDDANSFQVA